MNPLHLLVAVGLGGALGGMARYALSGVVARRLGETFPWGTLVVNASGALVIGFLAALPGLREHPAWFWAVFGFLGSYTTVSSFGIQTLALLRAGEYWPAVGNITVSLLLCLMAVATGLGLGSML